ncbi:hypothetical protein SARC_16165 [Sphaeroforma arctica JP610]|uniref:Uncharacterized protein n=1 Tax=Sphaeroforma arctica JP610 TaxID=667725 RepID=A0A0L0F515_9EUKA|nr:hypothetical protein SARC_16165 [Sphaeroforma arctica JP610]KNC71298.1 hypothetical protein SARC_16165 [Sphaeroforma arctica JP610]|eukprot:XP_014145200.1 hypothetical protein SARC_16165 [Sphaeroforma arctica JP610]
MHIYSLSTVSVLTGSANSRVSGLLSKHNGGGTGGSGEPRFMLFKTPVDLYDIVIDKPDVRCKYEVNAEETSHSDPHRIPCECIRGPSEKSEWNYKVRKNTWLEDEPGAREKDSNSPKHGEVGNDADEEDEEVEPIAPVDSKWMSLGHGDEKGGL